MSNETSTFLTPTFLAPNRLAPFPIGSWANLVLFTVEVVQAIHYFRSNARPRDSVFLKLAVITNLLADLAGTAACCATTYLYTTTYWGDAEAINKQYWPLTVIVFTIGVTLAVSQFFMITRYWHMTKHHVVFSLLSIILLGAVTGIFGSGVLLVLTLENENMKNIIRVVFMSLALLASVVGNVLISPLLFRQICKRSHTIGSRWKYKFGTLAEAGTLTAVVSIVICSTIPSREIRDTMVWIPFAFILARVYSCTMLFALSRRPESATARTGNATETSHVGAPTFTKPKGARDVGMMVLKMPPVAVMDDADAFRLTKKKIEIYEGREFDSDSDISRNLNDELEDMDEPGSRRQSLSASRRASLSSAGDGADRPYSPSNYSEAPDVEPQSPRIPWGSRSASPQSSPV
ncbi:hypothetical protein K438DRAFT_898339 [Mycena galopus ATCC 62051]|nr:hypothetical protein K438DRAFT_898339 [Mycena galopus ATCC 62051]